MIGFRRAVELLEPRLCLSATDLDAGFGQAGLAVGTFGGTSSRFADLARLPDGKLLAVGTRSVVTTAGGTTRSADDFLVARYTADGRLDTTFGGGDGFVTTDFGPLRPAGEQTADPDGSGDQARAVAPLADGGFVVVGTAYVQSQERSTIVVAWYRADGTNALSSAPGATVGGPGLSDTVGTAVAVTGDGRVVVAGTGFPEAGPGRFLVARFTADRALDSSFGTGGVTAEPYIYYRDDPDGPGGSPPNDVPSFMAAADVEVLPNGKILVGGTADVAYDFGIEQNSFALARYGSDGKLDLTFGDGGFVTGVHGDAEAGDLALRPDGSIVLAGGRRYDDDLGAYLTFSAARYTPAGQLDRGFGPKKTGFADTTFGPEPQDDVPGSSAARAVLVLPNGQLLSAGRARLRQDDPWSLALVRLGADGQPDAAFGSGGAFRSTALSRGEAIVLQPDGKLVVAGAAGPEGTEQAGLARFGALGTASVAGAFYDDANRNGSRDAGESPLVGWTAYADVNNNGQVDAGEPFAVSDVAGNYVITGMAAGAYRIREIRQDGWTRTQPGGAYPLGYYDLSLSDGQLAAANDFGNDLPAAGTPAPPNAAPTGGADAATTPQDAAVEIDVLANDADDDKLDPGSVAVAAAPAHGTAVVNPVTGRIAYTPAAGYAGADAFTYTVADDQGLKSAPVTVNVTITPATLGGTATAALPATAVGGQKAKAGVSVAVTNRSAVPVNGRVTISLFLSGDGVLNPGDAPVSAVGKAMRLRPGQARTLKLKVGAFPAVASDTYQVLARVAAPDGTASVLPAGSLAVVAFVDLTGSIAAAPPAPLSRGGRGTMAVLVRNAGNVAAAGRATIKVYASADDRLGDADRLVATVPVKLKLKPDGAKGYKVRFTLPTDLAAGPVTLIAAIDQDNAIAERNDANNTAATAPLVLT